MALLNPNAPATTNGNYPSDDGVLVQTDPERGATFDVHGNWSISTQAQLQQNIPGSSVWLNVAGAVLTQDGSIHVTGFSPRKFRMNVTLADGSTSIEGALNN